MKYVLTFFKERKNAAMVGIVITVAAFFYAALKAYYLPFTGDEASSYMDLLYMKPAYFIGNTPNTHLINSAWMRLASTVSSHPLALRFLSVLSTLLFGIAVIGILVESKKEILIAPVLLFSFLNPYFLDFFSLARGYAFATACMVVCVYWLCRYQNERSRRYFVYSTMAAALATISAYVMLNFYVLVLLWFLVESIRQNRIKEIISNGWIWGTHVLIITGVAYVLSRFKGLGGAWPVQHFWPDAWFSVIAYGSTFGSVTTQVFAWLTILVIVVTIYSVVTGRKKSQLLFELPGSLLWVVFGIFVLHFIQHNFLGAPYPSMRGFVYYYALIVLFIFTGWRFSNQISFVLFFCVLLIFILNFSKSVGLVKSHEAPWANDTHEMIEDLRRITRDDSISLGVSGIHADPFNFYILTQKLPWRNVGFGYDVKPGSKNFYYQTYQTGAYDYMILEVGDYNLVKEVWKVELVKWYPRTRNVLVRVTRGESIQAND